MGGSRTLDDWARRNGFRAVLAGSGTLDVVRKAIEERELNGEFSSVFRERSLSGFRYPGSGPGRPRPAVIVVAFPRPAHVLGFASEAGRIEAVLPPTYVGYRTRWEAIRRDLAAAVFGRDDAVETLAVPLKPLAVGLGLASYGRNNLAYAPDFGSFFQLAAYSADLPPGSVLPPEGDFRMDRQLEACGGCRACIRACPTGAISGDRFLIYAARCYTFHSESPAPLPPGSRPPSPDCLLGCLRCQMVCPVNRGKLRKERTGIEFDAEETGLFLKEGGLPKNTAGGRVLAKFRSLELTEDIELCRRGLRLMARTK